MKRVVIVIVALGLLTGASALAKLDLGASIAEVASERSAMGHVVAIDTGANTLVVRAAKESLSVAVDATTRIYKIDEPVELADIQSGDEVRVDYRVIKGTNLASVIAVQPVIAMAANRR